MATPISELLVKISADSSGLEKGFDQAGKQADNFAKEMGKAVAQAVAALAIFDKAVQGIQFNAMAEQAEVAFGTMLGSASEAQELIGKMFEFAKTTPFDFPGVRDAGKQLLAFGIEADNIIPTLKMLGDVGAGIGAPIGDLAYLFGTIRTQGKAMTQDLNQFANRGIPIWDELAKVVGKSGSELRKMVEAGKIGFPEIQKAFENMTAEGAKFGGLMEAQSQTFEGAVSNMNDALGQFGGSMTKGLMGPLEDLIRGITSLVETLSMAPAPIKDFTTVIGLAAAGLLSASAAAKTFGISLSSSLGPIGAITAGLSALAVTSHNLGKSWADQIWDRIGKDIGLTAEQLEKLKESGNDASRELVGMLAWGKDFNQIVAKLKSDYGLTEEQIRGVIEWTQGLTDVQKEQANQAINYSIARRRNQREYLDGVAAQRNAERARAEEEKKNLEAAESARREAQRQEEFRMQQRNDWRAVQDRLLKEGIITEEQYLKNRVKFQEDEIQRIQEAGNLTDDRIAKIKELQKYVEGYHKRLEELDADRPEKVQARLDSEAEIQKAADDARYAREIEIIEARQAAEEAATIAATVRHEEFTDEVVALIEAQYAEEDAMRLINEGMDQQDLERRSKLQQKYWEEIGTFTNTTFDIFKQVNDEFNLGMGDIIDATEKIATGVQGLLTSDGTDPTAWANLIIGGISLISDAWSVLSGERQKELEEELAAEKKAIEDAAAARLATRIETLKKEREAEIAKAVAVGADTRDTEIFFARQIAQAKLEMNVALLERERELNKKHAEILAAEARRDEAEALQRTKAEFRRLGGAISDAGARNSYIYQKYLAEATASLSQQAQDAMVALEESFIVFSDRAEDASRGIGNALISGFKNNQSEDEIKDAIWEMIEGMAIEAAIMAAGIGDRMEEIGAVIAEALADGIMSGAEFDTIDRLVDDLYKDAAAKVSSVSAIFGNGGPDKNEADLGTLISDSPGVIRPPNVSVTVNSPVAVDPVEATRILTRTMQSLSFTGAI